MKKTICDLCKEEIEKDGVYSFTVKYSYADKGPITDYRTEDTKFIHEDCSSLKKAESSPLLNL